MSYNNPTESVQEKVRYWIGIPGAFWPLAQVGDSYYCFRITHRPHWYLLGGFPALLYTYPNAPTCTELYIRLKCGSLPSQ